MRTISWLAAALLSLGMTVPAWAALEVGATAPDFSASASLAGKDYAFSLADALKSGPVVVYFYPKAFTQGCTIALHEFAQAMNQEQALGATEIGVLQAENNNRNKS